jgi:hypothetical protein
MMEKFELGKTKEKFYKISQRKLKKIFHFPFFFLVCILYNKGEFTFS